jgi:tetratricopeptide (TPR) repeat protein
MNEGNKNYKAQKYEAAIEAYKKILAVDPENWPANYQIAMSYLVLYHPGSTHAKDIEYSEKSAAAFEAPQDEGPDADTARRVHGTTVALLRSADKTDKAVATTGPDPEEPEEHAAHGPSRGDLRQEERCRERAQVLREARRDRATARRAWYTIGVVCWERSHRNKTNLLDSAPGTTTRDEGSRESPGDRSRVHGGAGVHQPDVPREGAVLSAEQKVEEAGDALTKADEYQRRRSRSPNRRKAAAATKAAG